MGKMLNLIFFALAIQFALVMFDTGALNMAVGSQIGCSTEGVNCTVMGANSTEEMGTLMNLALNPVSWQTNLLVMLLGNMAIVGGLIIGTFWMKNDFVVMAVIIGPLLSFGWPIIKLWQTISREGGIFGADLATSSFVASLFLFPIIIGYIWTVIEWWRSPQ